MKVFVLSVILCVVGLVIAPLPSVNEINTKIAAWAFRKFLKSTFNGDGIANLFPFRGMMPPDINPEEYSGKFQGDIVLDDHSINVMFNQYSMLRTAYMAPDTKWPNNTVVWQFNNNDFDKEQRAAIQDAIHLIENKTCVRFRQREPEESVYVSVSANATGCYSMLGYFANRGKHILNFAPHPPGNGCLRVGTIVHEWMHILGFFHMHSTHNRDDYVQIVKENIIPGMAFQFIILGDKQVSNLGIEYDYSSCMHYSDIAFSVNGNATIKALREFDGVMGQRDHVTDSDWLRINRHYDCPGAWD